jgi:hypothetical protein
MDKADRRQRERYGSAVPPHMRHHMQGGQSGHRNMRVDAHGQVIIDPEENLSDKEIYPAGNHINIPSIGTYVVYLCVSHVLRWRFARFPPRVIDVVLTRVVTVS